MKKRPAAAWPGSWDRGSIGEEVFGVKLVALDTPSAASRQAASPAAGRGFAL